MRYIGQAKRRRVGTAPRIARYAVRAMRFARRFAAMGLVLGMPATGLAQATLPANAAVLFAGPAQVGQSVTYRITRSMAAQETPDVSTVVITWKTPARLFARVSSSNPSVAVIVTRGNDGKLSIGAPPNDATTELVATLLNQLNFPGQLAALLGGSDHGQTTLSVPVPSSTASPAPQKSPAPALVPANVDIVNNGGSITLIADGNSNQNSSSRSGGGRRGGSMGGGWHGSSMGGWHSGGSGQDDNRSSGNTPSVEIAVDALFDQSGVLEHETYRETFTSHSSNGAQTTEHTITIDRLK
jgi:uncharacterized membrane protein YgcG